MKTLKEIVFRGALLAGVLALPVALRATITTAHTLSDFGGEEEPTVIYHPSSNTFTTGDTYVNITNPSSGTFQMLLRYSTSAWDGDRDTTNTDRQRAEVKTLGAHQFLGDTFVYTTTWKTSSGYKGSGQFDHITQLKPVDGVEGSSGAPLVTTSIGSGTAADVEYASANFSPADVYSPRHVRDFSFTAGSWVPLAIKITTTADGGNTGQVTASLNGDAFTGVTGVEVCRPSSTEYYPKWGLYRGASTSSGYGANDYIQHSNVTAGPAAAPTYTLEAENMSPTGSGATVSTQSDSGASGGVVVYLNATGTGQSVTMTTPSLSAGTYSVQFAYKGNTSRGEHTVKIDGTQVGGTVNEYASSSGYHTITVGNITFGSAGTHSIVLAVTGKSSSSSGYVLAPDMFKFIGQ